MIFDVAGSDVYESQLALQRQVNAAEADIQMVAGMAEDALTQIRDSGWINLTLQGNVTLEVANYPVQVRKIGKWVQLRGRVKNVTSVTAVITSVTAAYRPSNYTQFFTCAAESGKFVILRMANTTGEVQVVASSDGTYPAERWIALNSILYFTDV